MKWLYTLHGVPLPEPIEVGGEHVPDVPRSTGDLDKFQYNNGRALDGTDISSRTKRRDYMRANGLTDPSDFKNEWAQAAKKREEFFQGKTSNPALREAIGRIEYEQSKRRK